MHSKRCIAFAGSVLALVGSAFAQKKAGTSDAQYIAEALSAAPKGIAKGAAIVRFDKDGKMTTLRDGKNGFTCMVAGGNKMCADANSMAFFDAWMKHERPPDKLGVTYMMAGDNGASNTDPYATAKTADNHWVTTGPHVMIVGPAAKSLGLTTSEADPTGPYLMWVGTPYEHAMIPVGGAMPAMKSGAMKSDEMKK